MPHEQQALIVRASPTGTPGLAELNTRLRNGWRVTKVAPMGGTGLDVEGEAPAPFLAALVIVERGESEAAAVEALEEAEDEPEEIVEEIVEGDGAGPELPPDPPIGPDPNP